MILCESRSLAGVLHDVAATYACDIGSTNGQAKGHLIAKVAPKLQPGQKVLYLGDHDWCGHQIEAATRRTLIEHTTWWGVLAHKSPTLWEKQGLWERIALTEAQVEENNLPNISKADNRYKPVQHHDAVETEAFGQNNIVNALRTRLDELMPEPLDVLERERQQREQVAEQLRGLME